MTAPYLSVDGHRATAARVSMPYVGVWVADLELDTAVDLDGRVEVQVGTLALSGTVAERGGQFLTTRSVRVVGGAGGWGRQVPSQHHHNDAGVRRRSVVAAAAALVGETVVVAASADGSVGVDFVRAAGLASDVLRQLWPDTPWWVDVAGVTQVGQRASVEVDVEHQVLDHDPRNRTAVVATERPDAIAPGAVLRHGLTEPLYVRDVTIVADADGARVLVWGAPKADRRGNRLLTGLSRVVAATLPRYPFGFLYRYRVIQMSATRVALQAVRRAAGLPDVLPASVWPGMAGLGGDLTPGAVVLVAFVEGDPALPVVVAHSPEAAPGWKPVELRLDGGVVRLADGDSAVARKGDSASTWLRFTPMTSLEWAPDNGGTPGTWFPVTAAGTKVSSVIIEGRDEVLA